MPELRILGPSSDGKTFTGTAPAGALIRISTNGVLDYQDTVYADDQGNWSYTFPIAVQNLTVSIINVPNPVVYVPPPLAPSTANYPLTAAKNDVLATLSGLASNETFVNIRPNDGRVVIGADGKTLVRGGTAASLGSTTYNLVTSTGRVLQIVVTCFDTAMTGPVLKSLSSAFSFKASDLPGTTIGTIAGKTDGSSILFMPNDGRVTVVGDKLVVGPRGADRGIIVGTLSETLPGSTTVNTAVNITVDSPIVLNDLVLSKSSFIVGLTAGATIGTISGRTPGSNLIFTPLAESRVVLSSDGSKLVVGNTLAAARERIVGTLIETFSGVTHYTNVSISVADVPTVLSPITLSGTSYRADHPAGTVIGEILGKTPGSTLTFSPDDGRVVISGNQLVVGSAPSSQGTLTGTFTETLNGTTQTSSVSLMINAALPVLNNLTLANARFPANSAAGTVIGTLSGKTAGSTISLATSEPRLALSSDSTQLLVGLTATPSFGTINATLTETLSGVTRNSTIAVIVDAVLNTLTLSNSTFSTADAAGTVIGTIVGKTSGSTVTFAPNDGRVSVSGSNLVVGSAAASAGPISGTLTETLNGVTKTSNVTLTVSPVLNVLSLNNSAFTAGAAAGTIIGTISGKTNGSTLAVSPNDGRLAISGNNLVVGSAVSSAGSIAASLTETLAGAVGSPKTTSIPLTVNAAAPVLNTLTLDTAVFTAGAAQGTIIGTISGKTSGSALAFSPNDGRVVVSGNQLLVGSAVSSAGSIAGTLTEMLSGATGSPKSTSVTLTVNAAAPVLNALTLDTSAFTAGAAQGTVIGTISGKTSGSTLAFSPNDGRVVISGNQLVVGSAASSAGSIAGTITETLAGATGSPKSTSVTLTVNAAAPVLNALTLNTSSFTAGAAQGTVIGTISGKTSGSTLAFTPNDGRVVISGNNLVVGSAASSVGSITGTLTETLAGATGSPKSTSVTLTVNAAAPVLNTLTLDASTFTVGNASGMVIGNIVGKTSGSTITFTPNDNRLALSSDGTKLLVGTAASTAGTIAVVLTETLAGATGSPKTSNVTLTVNAAPASLGPTTAGFTTQSVSGADIVSITGLNSGETIASISPNDGKIAIKSGGAALVVGATASVAGTTSYTLTTSSGRTLVISITVDFALPQPPTGYGYIYAVDADGQNQVVYAKTNDVVTYPLVRLA